jgi:hypothetical protein
MCTTDSAFILTAVSQQYKIFRPVLDVHVVMPSQILCLMLLLLIVELHISVLNFYFSIPAVYKMTYLFNTHFFL